MSDLGWLTQPAVFPWVALAFGLCVGSFLNVVIHRLPKMMERAWRAECAELAGQPVPDRGPRYNLFVPRSRLPGMRPPHQRAGENIPIAQLARAARQMRRLQRAHQRCAIRWSKLLAGLGAACAAWHFGFGARRAGRDAVHLVHHRARLHRPGDRLPARRHHAAAGLGRGCCSISCGTFVPLRGRRDRRGRRLPLALARCTGASSSLTGKEGMGYGDFKMNAAVGAFLGWKMLPLVILLSSRGRPGLRRCCRCSPRAAAGTRTFASTSGPYLAHRRHRRACSGASRSCGWYLPSGRSDVRCVVGLTGGIGSGKSAAADEFARLGATRGRHRRHRARADRARRRRGPRGRDALFGKAFVDATGAMDRKQHARPRVRRPGGEAARSKRCCTR